MAKANHSNSEWKGIPSREVKAVRIAMAIHGIETPQAAYKLLCESRAQKAQETREAESKRAREFQQVDRRRARESLQPSLMRLAILRDMLSHVADGQMDPYVETEDYVSFGVAHLIETGKRLQEALVMLDLMKKEKEGDRIFN